MFISVLVDSSTGHRYEELEQDVLWNIVSLAVKNNK